MKNDEFYKLSFWQKTLTVITGYTAVLSTIVGILTINDMLKNAGYISLWRWTILLGGFVAICLLIVISGTFVIKIHRSIGEYGLLLIFRGKKQKELSDVVKESMIFDESINEIASYWGERKLANEDIINLLKQTKENVFISAIGFGTMKEILNNTSVINNIVEQILSERSTFRITIVYPDNYEIIRPEVGSIDRNVSNGQDFLIAFKRQLEEACRDKMTTDRYNEFNINSIIEFRTYNKQIMPRHFILHNGKTLYVGSYLCNTEGRKSYLIKLTDKEVSGGIFKLFKKEIQYIEKNSIESPLANSIK